MVKKLLAALGLVALVAGPAQAQDYPTKTIKLIAPFAPGGSVDIVGRILAQKMTESLGQTVVVENKPGASGMIGADMVAKSAPDGYTLLVNSSIHVIVPSLFSKVPYNALEDLVAVGQATEVPMVMLTGANSRAKSVQDVIAWAKAEPGVAYASAGSGSSAHLAGEVFKKATGVNLTHIPYKGSGAAMADVIGGQVPLMFDALTAAMGHIQGNKMRALAVSSQQRSPILPDVPTFQELKMPQMNLSTWHGVWAPKGTPPAIVKKLNAEIARIVALPDVREKIKGLGGIPVGNTPEQFDAYQRAELEKWSRIVKESGAKVD
ncbi:MAG: tripartite tricarboxylate transporter substrate binding protein [Burkholderiales bacterium]|nr:tripartite tricarboxylate transporter substrate binding protein [Burkholderiales bacterium]MBZ0248223.1 tripartite tricarboxylate transporter substrate binding protein [Burkholderiales bacterium]MCL4689584.1 tripartite tricarboxylate transporter substrate binding protein [Burkholderiales bacterium]